MEKKGQILGLPFSVIFSLFLIIFFIVIAVMVINVLLKTQKCTQVKMFVDDFQPAIDSAWNSQGISDDFKRTLPSNIDYVCFANLSKKLDDNQISFDISVFEEDNMFLYPLQKACEIPNHNIKHLDIEKITSLKNPYCIPVENGQIVIQIDKGFNDRFVSIS